MRALTIVLRIGHCIGRKVAVEFGAKVTNSRGGDFDTFASRLMRAGLLQRNRVRCCAISAWSSLVKLCIHTAMLVSLFLGATATALEADTASSRETQHDAIRRLPLQQLNRETQTAVSDVIDKPSFFRRMPTQTIDCDPEMFQHLVRHPEVLVNIWDVMGITKVQADRTGPFTFTADDGVGTTCKCDLVYGNDRVHIYYGNGGYKGSMSPRPITGRCVCVLYSSPVKTPSGQTAITGSMDVFLKLDNIGADLLTRTLSPLVGKTADYNFVESAKFLAQISLVCERNPTGAQILASKLTKVKPEVREEFANIARRIGESSGANGLEQYASLPTDGKFTSKVGRDSSATSVQGRISEHIALDTDPQSSLPINSQRVPAMSFSNSDAQQAPMLREGPASKPAAVVPAKPNIYMRR